MTASLLLIMASTRHLLELMLALFDFVGIKQSAPSQFSEDVSKRCLDTFADGEFWPGRREPAGYAAQRQLRIGDQGFVRAVGLQECATDAGDTTRTGRDLDIARANGSVIDKLERDGHWLRVVRDRIWTTSFFGWWSYPITKRSELSSLKDAEYRIDHDEGQQAQ